MSVTLAGIQNVQHLGGSTWQTYQVLVFVVQLQNLWRGPMGDRGGESTILWFVYKAYSSLCHFILTKERETMFHFLKQPHPILNQYMYQLVHVHVLLMNIHAELQSNNCHTLQKIAHCVAFLRSAACAVSLVCTKVSLCKIRFGFPLMTMLYKLIRVGTIFVQ